MTGANGLVGAWILTGLLRSGRDAWGMVREGSDLSRLRRLNEEARELNLLGRLRVADLGRPGELPGALEGVTCLIQSSSATTVMVVGFVNAGLLTLKQAIGVIIGANVGTTFTAWLVSAMSAFKISHYALPLVSIGFIINSFG